MSDNGKEGLRKLQEQLVVDSAEALNRNELNRLRQYWGDIQRILDAEVNGE